MRTSAPHERAAATLLRQALNDVGLTHVDFDTRTISDAQQAADAHFVGSPTFLIEGRDPFSDPSAVPALACRVYATPAGLAGLPGIEPLRQALKEAAGRLRPRDSRPGPSRTWLTPRGAGDELNVVRIMYTVLGAPMSTTGTT